MFVGKHCPNCPKRTARANNALCCFRFSSKAYFGPFWVALKRLQTYLNRLRFWPALCAAIASVFAMHSGAAKVNVNAPGQRPMHQKRLRCARARSRALAHALARARRDTPAPARRDMHADDMSIDLSIDLSFYLSTSGIWLTVYKSTVRFEGLWF